MSIQPPNSCVGTLIAVSSLCKEGGEVFTEAGPIPVLLESEMQQSQTEGRKRRRNSKAATIVTLTNERRWAGKLLSTFEYMDFR